MDNPVFVSDISLWYRVVDLQKHFTISRTLLGARGIPNMDISLPCTIQHNHVGKERTSITLSRHLFQMTPLNRFFKYTSLESDASSLTRYLCHDTCSVYVAKNKYHCCLWFRIIKYGHTSVLTDCMRWSTWLARICYTCIYSTSRFSGHRKEKCWNFSWKNYPFCHAMDTLGENVQPGADALKQTLKAINYV